MLTRQGRLPKGMSGVQGPGLGSLPSPSTVNVPGLGDVNWRLVGPEQYPVVDGFLYNPAIRYTGSKYFALALSQLEILRRANLYNPRWWVVPDDLTQPVAAYDTLEYQLKVEGGSYLWGLQYNEYTVEEGHWSISTPSNILIEVTDSCTGIPLFNDFAGGSAYSTYKAPSSDLRGAPTPILLPQPKLILEPGLVDVELANKGGNSVYCQLLLLFAQPCGVVGEVTRYQEG